MGLNDQVAPWWHWPLMPIAAIAGGLLGSVALALVQWFSMKLWGGASEDGWYYLYILPVFSAGLFGYLYTLIAWKMAPAGKLLAGTVMLTILGLVTAFGTLVGWLSPDYSVGHATQATVSLAAIIFGGVIALQEAPR